MFAVLVIFLTVSWSASQVLGATRPINAYEPPPMLTYTRDFLMSRRACSTKPDYAIPDVCSNTPRPRKRGKKGGIRQRLKQAKPRIPLPAIMQGNVQSVRNKTDELRACTRYLSEYRNASLICLTETWLTEHDPDSLTEIEGFTLIRNDRTALSGKSKGGGVCAFVSEKYCHSSHITLKQKVCTKDIELLSIFLRPFYLPREIHQIRLFVVYIPPTADIYMPQQTPSRIMSTRLKQTHLRQLISF